MFYKLLKATIGAALLPVDVAVDVVTGFGMSDDL